MTTRPDILHSVTKLAQWNIDQHKEHEVGAKRILRYLRGTTELKLHYQNNGQPIHGYVDADWAGDSSDRKSFSGCSSFAACPAFTWESKKQSVVALSTTEAENVAFSSAANEAVYIMKLVDENDLRRCPGSEDIQRQPKFTEPCKELRSTET
ncbi:secreted RxLR effector protein 161-like [Drosophila simulans]|uniref:secreted RxLR effector protein 161-like n=1 Tax=Drosophila simulans TaxID=7240 RepID=UPI001D103179|nr:secreted RxLR effector protein 161-like [Drosophila simulans]